MWFPPRSQAPRPLPPPLPQFFYGVSFYVVATLMVLFLPIFVSSTVDKTMLILQVCLGAWHGHWWWWL